MAYPDYKTIMSKISVNLPKSPLFLIGTVIDSLISGFTLWLAVRMVGGDADYKKAFIFSLLMNLLGIFVFPLIPSFLGLFTSIIISILIWIILVMKFFRVGFLKAIAVAIVQFIVSLVLGFLAIGALIIGLTGLRL